MDDKLFKLNYGNTERTAWQCTVMIVADESAKVRRLHKCCEEGNHKGPHECGCQKWWKARGKWFTSGPLANVVVCWDIDWTDDGPVYHKADCTVKA